MPLLGGRHKSGSASASASASRPTPERMEQGQQQQVCQSPLFGMRRQLPMNEVAAASGRRASPARHDSNQPTTASDISSVPHQISRQQIHYAFAIMDTNADGMLDVRDLSRTLANLGVPIDESILSHLMSRLSKQGEQRISEDEFLSWIADFIQVNDGPAASSSSLAHRQVVRQHQHQHQSGANTSPHDNSLMAGPSPGQVDALRNGRRGSGSGLALMRALTSSKHSSSSNSSSSPPPSPSSKSGAPADWQVAALEASKSLAEAEARKDLRAAFCVFDLDGDGFITLEEVGAGLRLLGESWTPLEVRQVFSQCQWSRRTGSGAATERISIEQFIQMLL